MKNYTQVQDGVYQSVHTSPTRKVDEERIREIIKEKDKNSQKSEEQRKSAAPAAFGVLP